MTPFTPKNWQDAPSTSTPITAGALEDLETRVAGYTDVRLGPLEGIHSVMVEDFGAVPDGATNNAAAINAAIAALPVVGGYVDFEPGTYNYASQLDVEGIHNVRFRGAGGRGNSGGHGTVLQYTGTGATAAINLKKTRGFRAEGIQFIYDDAAFTGRLLDMRNDSGSGVNDTTQAKFDGCFFGSQPTSIVSAEALVSLDGAHTINFDSCTFKGGDVAVLGQEAAGAGYATGVSFTGNCLFWGQGSAHLKNGGGNWFVEGATFEPLIDGSPGVYRHAAAERALGLTFLSCWFGDLSAVGDAAHIIFSGDALVFIGNAGNAEEAGTGYIKLDENDCQGLLLGGNRLNLGDYLLAIGVTTGHTGMILPNEYNSMAAVTTGTVPSGLHVFNSAGALTTLTMAAGITMGATGAVISRSQASTNEFLVSRASGDAADRLVQRHSGHIWRGSGAATPIGQVGMLHGTGSPEGVQAAGPGSVWQRSDAPDADNAFYFKGTGTGNTGWKRLTTTGYVAA